MSSGFLLRRMSAQPFRQIGIFRVNDLHISSVKLIEQSSYECTLAILAKKNTTAWCIASQHASSVQRSVLNYFYGAANNLIGAVRTIVTASSASTERESIWLSSTMKKRRMKMNKHKLKKRMKDMRANTKVSRG
jgi:Mitochondrial domain of unknown function (DUF1713)